MVSIKEVSRPFSWTIREIIERYRSPLRAKRVDVDAYISVLRQLAVMLDAGLAINQCLQDALETTDNAMLKEILRRVLNDIEGGISFTDALKPFERQLGSLTISMVNLGEQTGTLPQSIERLADVLEQIQKNRQQLIKATRYPLFTIFVMAIAFVVVIVMVVPQFQQMFAQSHAELPFPTKLLIWTKDAAIHFGPYIVTGAILVSIVYSYFYKQNEKVHLETDRMILKIYIVGKVTQYAMVGRFVYIFNILLNAGIPITDAIEAAAGVVENTYIKERLMRIRRAIEEGRSLTDGFRESGMFLNMIVQMVKAGEQGGALSKMLEKISRYYQERYQFIVDNVAAMIEPILIMAIAGFVLVLALGIFLPMWNMAEAMGM